MRANFQQARRAMLSLSLPWSPFHRRKVHRLTNEAVFPQTLYLPRLRHSSTKSRKTLKSKLKKSYQRTKGIKKQNDTSLTMPVYQMLATENQRVKCKRKLNEQTQKWKWKIVNRNLSKICRHKRRNFLKSQAIWRNSSKIIRQDHKCLIAPMPI